MRTRQQEKRYRKEQENSAKLELSRQEMTANAFSEDIRNCLEAGTNAHVSKPIDMPVLEQTIRRVLGLESEK